VNAVFPLDNRTVANSLSNLFGKLLKRDPEGDGNETGGAYDLQGPEHRKDPRAPVNAQARAEWFDEHGACRSQPITILDTSEHGLAFLIDEAFPVDQTIWIETQPDDISKTVIRHREPRSNGFLIGAYRVDRERRRQDRLPAMGGAMLHWGDSQVGPCDSSVNVRNATEFGLQIECAVPLPVGTIVQVQGDQLQCDGSTCYCLESGDKFIIGLHMVRQAYSRNSLDFKGD
jgi:hypothetical protein